MLTASHDPLRDQGVLYHHALLAAGGRSAYKEYEGVFHAWFLCSKMVEPEPTEEFMEDMCTCQ